MFKILAVDDEPKNLKLIKGFLADAYDVVMAADGVLAWEILEKSYADFDAIVLDRMMPNMDGIQLTMKIKAHPVMRDIPIIMQTAAAHKDQIVEGIGAGVYYCLTKPYDAEILLSIVGRAVQDFCKQRMLHEEIRKHKKILGMMEECSLSFQKLEDAEDLIAYLASFFPEPEQRAMGISELLINAIEHGNLGISYSEKTQLSLENSWQQEVERRQALPENSKKYVHLHYGRTKTEAFLIIKDEGEGFEWERYMDIDPARATDPHGRGIAMSRMMSFDELEYRGNGNEVCAKVKIGGIEI